MSKMISTLFSEQSLVFESKNLNTNKVPVTVTEGIPEIKFGLLSLQASEANISKKELEMIFQVDCSGSMDDKCTDGRNKMQHILHTLRNMILFFKENTDLKVNVTICAFDEKIYKIVNRTHVNEDTHNKIIAAINSIAPKGATNIEVALNNASQIANQLKKEHPESVVYHILMTDGCPTVGNGSHNYLQGLVNNNYTNVFIGFGIDHDAMLLNTLGEANDKSANYFIDQLENAGLVYGEILHSFVYKLLENVELTVLNGHIYDFKTNTWNTTLKVGDLVGESIKYYHVISETPNTCKVHINGNKTQDETVFSQVVDTDLSPVDLSKYIYRQQTQQILYKINDFLKKTNVEKKHSTSFFAIPNFKEEIKDYTKEKQQLKEELTIFFEELKKYMEENEMQEDILLKNLCDDIYICHRTFGTQYADMFCGARMSSQGNQRTYNATQIPDDEPYFGLQRSNALQDYDKQEDEDQFIPPPSLLRHEISDSLATPYRTASNMRVMRDVSGTST